MKVTSLILTLTLAFSSVAAASPIQGSDSSVAPIERDAKKPAKDAYGGHAWKRDADKPAKDWGSFGPPGGGFGWKRDADKPAKDYGNNGGWAWKRDADKPANDFGNGFAMGGFGWKRDAEAPGLDNGPGGGGWGWKRVVVKQEMNDA